MIDHVSVPVRDLQASALFYERVLAPLGYARLVERPATVGFGKKYPEFWLNLRTAIPPIPGDTGMHVCLRAPSEDAVRTFHALALAHGGSDEGEPGPRQGAMITYYGAFIKDPDGNKIEAVTFAKT
jgi:catechol 2,3-dioxygenase-like lactoylglutathione lyase family enzyme